MPQTSAPITRRQAFESFGQAPPVDARLFRELMRRAPVGSWLAVVRTPPLGIPAPFAKTESFALFLVDPAARRVEPLHRYRGGPRLWTDLDAIADFVSTQLAETKQVGRLDVHLL